MPSADTNRDNVSDARALGPSLLAVRSTWEGGKTTEEDRRKKTKEKERARGKKKKRKRKRVDEYERR